MVNDRGALVLTIDATDVVAVIAAVAELIERLPWPERARFRDEVLALTGADLGVVLDVRPRGGSAVACASPELMDLIRKYDPVSLPDGGAS